MHEGIDRKRWFGLVLLCAAMSAGAADRGSGHFRLGDNRIEVKYAIAVVRDEGHELAGPETLIYLSDMPLDSAKVAAAFDPEDAVREQLGNPPAGYVRICINPDGDECGLFYSPEGFNSGGYGALKLEAADAAHVAGSWTLATPESFFQQTYDFDLRFDVAITPPPGTELPAGGGAPAKAYRAYVAALAKGDLPALRQLTDQAHGYRFPQDDDNRARESLKSARDGEPVNVEILRGRIHGQTAVLWVEGVDRDEIRRRGRVRMFEESGAWHFVESDLDSVDD